MNGPPLTDESEAPLADRIRALMQERGTNQYALAKAAGLHADKVRDILRGKARDPGAHSLLRIAKALETTVGDLLGETPSVAASVDDTRGPSPPRPSGSEGNGATTRPAEVDRLSGKVAMNAGRIRLDLQADVSAATAAKIFALIAEDGQ